MLMLLDSNVMVIAMLRENELTASVATTASISCDEATRLPWPRKPGAAEELSWRPNILRMGTNHLEDVLQA